MSNIKEELMKRAQEALHLEDLNFEGLNDVEKEMLKEMLRFKIDCWNFKEGYNLNSRWMELYPLMYDKKKLMAYLKECTEGVKETQEVLEYLIAVSNKKFDKAKAIKEESNVSGMVFGEALRMAREDDEPKPKNKWIVGKESLKELAEKNRLQPVLIRTGSLRFIVQAQSALEMIEMVEATGDYIRDVSIKEDVDLYV